MDDLTEQWTAVDRVLARPVIVEILSQEAGARSRQAFVSAVAAAARLVHPAIEATYDSGLVPLDDGGAHGSPQAGPERTEQSGRPGTQADATDGPGLPYVVTERPTGPTLTELIARQGPMAVSRVVVVGRQLARALQAAHRIGVSHGAVGPSSVVVGEDDRVKLTRFAASSARARLVSGTTAGAVGGTGGGEQTEVTSAGAAGTSSGTAQSWSGGWGAGGRTRSGGTGTGTGTGTGGWPGGGAGAAPGAAEQDVRDLADTLVGSLLGAHLARGETAPASARTLRAGVPPALDTLLSAARDGRLHDAGQLADALDTIDVADDAEPALRWERTPRLGVPVSPPPQPYVTRGGRAAGIVVGALLLAAVAVGAIVLTRTGAPHHAPTRPGSPGSQTTAGKDLPLTITGGHSFNPMSPDDPNKQEQEPLIHNVYDGDPSTLWSTSSYVSANFGSIKSGTGLYVTLDRPRALKRLTVTSPTPSWTFQVYVADQAAADLAGWGKAVGSPTPTKVTTGTVDVDLAGAKGAAVLVWITDLGPARPGDPSLPYRVDIGEIVLH